MSTLSGVAIAGVAITLNPQPDIERFRFEDDGAIPNNPTLELLLYRELFTERGTSAAEAVEKIIASNGWNPSWRWGIFSYHHYHSTAHELLICYQGSATVKFGGAKGKAAELAAGDAVLIPAGVGHKLIESSGGFAVVGAYPEGQVHDMRTGKPAERPLVIENIAAVAPPKKDPFSGALF